MLGTRSHARTLTNNDTLARYLKGDAMLMKLSNPQVCGKMKVLLELMKEWKKDGSKVSSHYSNTRTRAHTH